MKNGRYEEDERVVYYKDDVYHREDGPAVVFSTGTKFWFWNGKYHRLDGPAMEGESGYQAWYVDDQKIDIIAILGYEPTIPLSEEEQVILRLSM